MKSKFEITSEDQVVAQGNVSQMYKIDDSDTTKVSSVLDVFTAWARLHNVVKPWVIVEKRG